MLSISSIFLACYWLIEEKSMHDILALYNLYQILGPMVPKYVIVQHISPCAWYYRSGHERDLCLTILLEGPDVCIDDVTERAET